MASEMGLDLRMTKSSTAGDLVAGDLGCEIIYRGSTPVRRTKYLFLMACVVSTGTAMAASDPCSDSRNLKLVNGKIVTMDKKNSIVSSITIQNGIFDSTTRPAPCTKIIDLHGRTVIPGLVDNHNHIVQLGLRPGHDTRIETAASMADVQALIAARA